MTIAYSVEKMSLVDSWRTWS